MRKEDEDLRLEALLSHLERLLPASQRPSFRHHALQPPLPTLRLNTLQPAASPLRQHLNKRLTAVPWCPDAFELDAEAPRLGHCLEHLLGGFYIQAKATTLAVEALDPQPGECVLDLAAAPGGKATQIAARMANTGLLVANEPRSNRMPALVGNLERLGVSNTVLSKAPGTLLKRYFAASFDRVLLDAPCSGDGVICKNRQMLRYWSPEEAGNKAQQQKGLLRAAFDMLKPDGILVYSTCSLSLEENEEVLLGLVQKYPDQVEMLPIAGIDPTPLPAALATRYPPAFAHAVRIWPHHHQTEGAFVARLQKRGSTTAPSTPFDAPPPIDAEAATARQHIEERWNFSLTPPQGQSLSLDKRYLHLWPDATPSLRQDYPHFLRGGTHFAHHHKGYSFLTQQAVTFWGHRMDVPSIELDWQQTQTLFANDPLVLPIPIPGRGERLARYGPWTLCRVILAPDGCTLESTLPKALRCLQLARLV